MGRPAGNSHGPFESPGIPDTGAFVKKIRDYYRRKGRDDLPWRHTTDPYRILVSEVMLQQTQVRRVMSKYGEFISAFPGFLSLSGASLGDVLRVWKGTGYNRRAIALREIAQIVITEYDGILPPERDVLETFPGIGAATSASIAVFAFNTPEVFIETNIRRVFIHCFFRDRMHIADREILPLVELTLDRSNPREWYYALMDAGAALGRSGPNPNIRSTRYRKQPPFEGSARQIRGRVLDLLLEKGGGTSEQELLHDIGTGPERLASVLRGLEKDGFIVRDKDGGVLIR
jgi:A/G-specific adenine glycosylase